MSGSTCLCLLYLAYKLPAVHFPVHLPFDVVDAVQPRVPPFQPSPFVCPRYDQILVIVMFGACEQHAGEPTETPQAHTHTERERERDRERARSGPVVLLMVENWCSSVTTVPAVTQYRGCSLNDTALFTSDDSVCNERASAPHLEAAEVTKPESWHTDLRVAGCWTCVAAPPRDWPLSMCPHSDALQAPRALQSAHIPQTHSVPQPDSCSASWAASPLSARATLARFLSRLTMMRSSWIYSPAPWEAGRYYTKHQG